MAIIRQLFGLQEIPKVICRPEDIKPEPGEPPLNDLAEPYSREELTQEFLNANEKVRLDLAILNARLIKGTRNGSAS